MHLLQVEEVVEVRDGFRAIPFSGPHDPLAQMSVSIHNHRCGKISDHEGLREFFLFIQEGIKMQLELLPKYFDFSRTNIGSNRQYGQLVCREL